MKFRITSILRTVLFMVLPYLFLRCSGEEKQVQDIVAEVNEAFITSSEIEKNIPDNLTKDMKVALKRKFIVDWNEKENFFQSALKQDIELSEDELGMFENYRKQMLVQKYLSKYVNKNYNVLDREVEEYYKKNKEEFKWSGDHVRIIHLVVKNYDASLFREISQSNDLLAIITKNYLDYSA